VVSWGETPITVLTDLGSRLISKPITLAVPRVGFSRQHSMLIVVVLPLPFGPSRANSSPLRISRFRLSTALTAPKERLSSKVWMAKVSSTGRFSSSWSSSILRYYWLGNILTQKNSPWYRKTILKKYSD
jgi:hypothetical protein